MLSPQTSEPQHEVVDEDLTTSGSQPLLAEMRPLCEQDNDKLISGNNDQDKPGATLGMMPTEVLYFAADHIMIKR